MWQQQSLCRHKSGESGDKELWVGQRWSILTQKLIFASTFPTVKKVSLEFVIIYISVVQPKVPCHYIRHFCGDKDFAVATI